MQAASLLLLARVLGPADLGIFTLVLVIQSLVAVVANAGMFAVTQYHAGSDELPLDRTVAAGLVGTIVATAMLVPPLSFVLAWSYPTFLPGLPFELLVLGLLAGPLRIGSETLLGALIGRGDPRAQALLSLVGAAALLVPLVIAAANGALDLGLAIRVWVAAQVATLAAAVLRVRRLSTIATPRSVALDPALWRGVVRLGAGAYFVYLLFWASLRVDRVALNLSGGAEALGMFAIAGWVAESLNLVPTAVANVLYPRLALAARGSETADIARAVRATIAALAILAIPLVAFVGLASSLVAGPSFTGTLPLLLVLLPGQVLFATVAVLVNLTIARGTPTVGALYYAAMAVARIGLILALVRPFGLFVAMSAVGFAMAGIGVVAGIHLSRLLGCDARSVLLPRPLDVRAMVATVAAVLRPWVVPLRT
jgi:O-antigen/teichoic acid export membrane protein